MDPFIATIIAIIILLLLISLRLPVAIALAAAGLTGIMLLDTSATPSSVIQSVPFTATSSFSWTVIPLFVLMGSLVTASGLVSSMFRVAARVLRWLPGGLGQASVAACAGFSAISGSSVATAASLGSVAGREMTAAGYRGSFAAGIIASAGTLGVLIPPSIVLVIYGMTTGESVGRLLIAGIVPGILSAIAISLTVIVVARLFPRIAFSSTTSDTGSIALVGSSASANQRTPRRGGLGARAGSSQVGVLNKEPIDSDSSDQPEISGIGLFFRILLLFGSIMGGIYFGWFTVTEAAAVGALVAFVIAVLDTAKRGARSVARMLIQAGRDAAATSGMLFLIIFGASVFTYFFVLAGVPAAFSGWILSWGLEPLAVVGVILLAMIPLGLFLEPMSIILIVMPLAYPILVTELGFSGIWFGILAVKMIEIGLVTPPLGLNIFVTAGVMKGLVTTAQAFRGVVPFIVADLFLVTILFLFPDLVMTWVPDTL